MSFSAKEGMMASSDQEKKRLAQERLQDRLIVSLCIEGSGKVTWLAKELEGIISTFEIPVLANLTSRNMYYLADKGYSVMLDLRCVADPRALRPVLRDLILCCPTVISISVFSGIESLKYMRQELEDIEIAACLGVGSFTEREYNRLFNSARAVMNMAQTAQQAGITSLVCLPHEFDVLRNKPEMSTMKFYVRNVVPGRTTVPGLDRSDTITPEQAVRSGVNRMIVGEPIVDSADPKAAAQAILEEAKQAQGKIADRDTITLDIDALGKKVAASDGGKAP